MSFNPKVTVVIASYNHKKYIELAVQSILRQTYDNIELIVIDDGSTDGSVELLRNLSGKSQFRLIEKANGGIVSVFNRGIQEATGEYVLFHASDDESILNRIRVQVDVLSRFPKAAFVSSNLSFLTESGKYKGTLFPVDFSEKELNFEDVFLRREKVSSVTALYRARALKEMGNLDARYVAEDPQIFLRLTKLGYTWVQHSGEPILNYRLLSTSQSRTKMGLLLEQNLELLKEFASHPDYGVARCLVKFSIASNLAEKDKIKALRVLGEECQLSHWRQGLRVLGKIILPRSVHILFKKAG